MALCAAGLRSWLDERGELPAEPLLGVIPVSVRTREQMGTFGNQVSAMTVELPTHVADPGQRLRRVSETMIAAKERHRALPASLMAGRQRAHSARPVLPRRASNVSGDPHSRVSISQST